MVSIPALLGTAALGLFVGTLSGVFGVGGGFLLTPALHVLFGVDYPTAVGTSLFAIPLYSGFGIVRHFLQRHVALALSLITFAFMIPGVFCGTFLLRYISLHAGSSADLVLDITFLAVMGSAAALVVDDYRRWKRRDRPPRDPALLRYRFSLFGGPPQNDEYLIVVGLVPLALLGVVSGLLSGLLGIGGGFVLTPALIALFGLPSIVSVGSSLFIVGLAALLGALLHGQTGHVDVLSVVMLAVGASMGSFVGSGLSARFRGAGLRLGFLVVIGLAVLMIVLPYLF